MRCFLLNNKRTFKQNAAAMEVRDGQEKVEGHSPVDIIIHNDPFGQLRPGGCQMELTATPRNTHKMMRGGLHMIAVHLLNKLFFSFCGVYYMFWECAAVTVLLPDCFLTGPKRKFPKLHPAHLTSEDSVKVCHKKSKITTKPFMKNLHMTRK